MEIGSKILELRKKNNLSQEDLAEKVGVTRQTISKWELSETSPDLKQAKILSKAFKVSLDELVDNDVKEILVEKVSNTEKLAGTINKVLKIIGILFIILVVVEIIAFILFAVIKKDVIESNVTEVEMTCSMDETEYLITVGSDGYFNCSNCNIEMQKELKDNYIDFSDIGFTQDNIMKYFENNNGNCE